MEEITFSCGILNLHPVKQIRRINEDNLGIIFVTSP